MTKLPPDIDRLLWDIAESHDPKAIDEFGQRFPHLRTELGKRLRMVESLKTARSKVKNNIPQFKHQKPVPRTKSALLIAAWALALLALASASFLITKLAINGPQKVTSSQSLISTEQAPKKKNINNQRERNGTNLYSKSELPPNGSGTPSVTGGGAGNAQESTQVQKANSSHNHLISMRLHNVPLQTAIDAVAISGHFSVQFAPGLSNPKVNMSYTDSPAIDVLKDLGQTFNFTPIRQSKHFYLLIPARNNSGNNSTRVNGGASLSIP